MFHFNMSFLILFIALFISSENVWAQECVDLSGKYSCTFQKEGRLYERAVLLDQMGTSSLLKSFDTYSFELQVSQSIDEVAGKKICVFNFVNVSSPNEAPQVVIADGKHHPVPFKGESYDVFSSSSQKWLKTVMTDNRGNTFISTNQLDENGYFVIEVDIVTKSHTDGGTNSVGPSEADSDGSDSDGVKKYVDGTVKGVLFRKVVCTKKEPPAFRTEG